MRTLRTIAVTFAQYSRIPMPRFDWKDEDMRYSMAVFPWVGAVIGAFVYLWHMVCTHFEVPSAAGAMIMAAIPLIVTGGFHADGFMDVSDARSSYGSREEKLRILKDPHIGAFAVIRLAIAGLIYLASLIILSGDREAVLAVCLGFFFARALSALAVLSFKSARHEGMLFYEAGTASEGRKGNLIINGIWIAGCAALMMWAGGYAGSMAVCTAILTFWYYRRMTDREFGGITGDTAGWFVTVCEVAMAAAAALYVMVQSR
jgi:adenosylcobinamide-GDP ribazoletransferase